MMDAESIQYNYQVVTQRMAMAAQRVGRDPADVHLVVVTKTHPVELIRPIVELGARWLGENYVEAALPKMRALSDLPVAWHMIGHVQSRKADLVAANFQAVHSLDSIKLAKRLEYFALAQGHPIEVLLECNTSGEESKFGWPAWDEDAWPALVEQWRPLLDLPQLKLQGLMTMAPYADDAETARPFFQRLRRLRDFACGHLPFGDLPVLSMGMSGDFEVAIEEGATWVRIGTRIFGPRSIV